MYSRVLKDLGHFPPPANGLDVTWHVAGSHTLYAPKIITECIIVVFSDCL